MEGKAARLWEPGEVVLDLYEVLDVLHSGGMGLVYQVRHRGWQLDLAVKTPRPDLVRTPHGRARFEAEANAWVRLGLHPHMVNCVYVRTVDGIPRVFAEWVAGGTLEQAIRSGSLYEGGPAAATRRILDIAIQMAWALAHAHAADLIHQDVKPANVMLEPDGTAKVTDFGLAGARAAGGEDSTQRPQDMLPTASFGGMTPAYCSPEQAAAAAGRSSARLTPATDVWSWAVSVLEMFVGHRLTRYGQAAGEALERHLRDASSEDPRIPALPSRVAALLRQCFAPEPAARPPGFAVVAMALSDLHRQVTGTVYERPEPKAVHLLPDSLSNQALSLLDLGKTEEAEGLLFRAVRADPHHLPAVYNLGLHEWRAGRLTGEELVSDLEAARAADAGAPAGLGALLLGCVELELQESGRSGELLREAVAAAPSSADAVAALAEWESRPPQLHADLEGHATDVSAVAVNSAGSLVLSGDRAGRVLLWAPGETRRRRRRRTLTRRGQPVTAAAMDTSGGVGVIIRDATSVEVWDLKRRCRRHALTFDGGALRVPAVAVSGNGRYIATGQPNGVIHVWEAETLAFVAVLFGHTGKITSLALSYDGSRALSAAFDYGDGDGTIRSWDVARLDCLATLRGPVRGSTMDGRPVRFTAEDVAAVATDAMTAVVIWEDGPLTVWNAWTGMVMSEVPHTLRYTTSRSLATYPGTLLTSTGAGLPIELWDVATGRRLRSLDQQIPSDARWIEAAAMSGDGRIAVLGAAKGKVVVRSLPTTDYHAPWCYARPRAVPELTRAADAFGELMNHARDLTEQGRFASAAKTLRSAQRVPGFARHPSLRSAWVTVGAHGRRSTLLGAWRQFEYDGHGVFTQPPTIALDQDGHHVATGRWTGKVDLWDFATGKHVHTFDRGRSDDARDIRFTSEGRTLTVHTREGTLRRLILDDRGNHMSGAGWGPATAFAFAPSEDRLLLGDTHGTLQLLDLHRGRILHTLPAHAGAVHAVALSPDGRFMGSLGSSGPGQSQAGGRRDECDLRLWAVGANTPSWTLASVPRAQRVDFTADGQLLIVSDGVTTTALDTATGASRYQIVNMGGWVLGQSIIDFSADRRLAATADKQALKIWETATGRVVHSLSLPETPHAFALAADGAFAVTGGSDRMVRVWELRSGSCLRTLEGHGAGISTVVLSRDGSRLASADYNQHLWLWELAWDFDIPSKAGD